MAARRGNFILAETLTRHHENAQQRVSFAVRDEHAGKAVNFAGTISLEAR